MDLLSDKNLVDNCYNIQLENLSHFELCFENKEFPMIKISYQNMNIKLINIQLHQIDSLDVFDNFILKNNFSSVFDLRK